MMMMMMMVVVVVMIMMKNTKYGAPRYAVVCRLLSPFHTPMPNVLHSILFCNTLNLCLP
jgi:hypothetical protein